MDRKTLETLGLEKELIDKVLDAHSADIGKHKKQIEDLTGERDTLKAQSAEHEKQLEALKAVDAEGLQAKIAELEAKNKAAADDFAAKIADRDFTDLVYGELTAAKARNPKAVMGYLDIESLKGSKNQKEDVAASVKALLESDAYLFSGDEPKPTPAKFKTGGEHHEPSGDSSDSFVAAAMKGAGLNPGKEG